MLFRSDGLYLTNQKQFQFVNKRFCEITGYSFEELTSEEFDYDYLLSEKGREIVAKRKKAIDNGESIPNQFILEMRKKTGEIVEIELSTVFIGDPKDYIVIGVMRDITERNALEKKIQESESQYKQLFDEMLSGFALHEIICDNQGKPIDYKFIRINSAFENITGLKASEVIGKTVLEVLPNTEKFWIERYGEVALTGKLVQFDEYSSVLDKYFEVKAYCPKLNTFAVIFNDITERKKNELNLIESEKKFRTLIENASDRIVLIDTEYNHLYHNNAFFSSLVYTEEEYFQIGEANLIHADDFEIINEANSILFKSGKSQTEFRMLHKDGHWMHFQSSSILIYDNKNSPKTILSIIRDITERKMIEEKMLDYTVRLTELNGTKDKFFSIIAQIGRASCRERV